MKKKYGFSLVVALVMVLSIVSGVVAQGQTYWVDVEVDPKSITVEPGEVVDLSAVAIAYGQNPQGTISKQNMQFVSDVWGALDSSSADASSYLSNIESASAQGAKSDWLSTAKFSSNVQGVYTVRYTITLSLGNTDYSGYDESEITVTGEVVVVYECPAAPAIAARLLRDADVSHRYGPRGNYISDVAHEMGSSPGDMNGSWFQGLPKCISVDGMDVANPAYEAAVLAFLESLGAFD